MFKRIVVPLDGSQLAESAVAPAVSLAKAMGAVVVLLHVGELPTHPFGSGGARPFPWAQLAKEDAIGDQPPMTMPSPAALEQPGWRVDQQAEELRWLAEGYLIEIADRVRALGADAEIQFLLGQPAHEIVEYAARQDDALVVMATHGRSGVGRWVFGSVADKVLRASSAPVLLVRAHVSGITAA